MQDDNQKNLLLAIVLSVAVLLAWQVFYAGPKLKEDQERKQRSQLEQQVQAKGPAATPQATPQGAPGAAPQAKPGPGVPSAAPTGTEALTREAALKLTPRVEIDTPSLKGSIALQGGRIDDLVLAKYRETVDPKSANVVLFSPSRSPHPYYSEYGWSAGAGVTQPMPGRDTVWSVEGGRTLTPTSPVTLVWDNGQQLVFRRTISVDTDYLFTVADQVENKSGSEVALHSYALISRHGMPKVEGYYILHEGLIGVVTGEKLQELTYAEVLKEGGSKNFKQTGGWLGITDKYWAAALIPDQKAPYEAHFSGFKQGGRENFQTDYLMAALSIAPGAKSTTTINLFAGAKQMSLIEAYGTKLGAERFDMLIDWGWFYFITKPLFRLLHWLWQQLGNYGLAILATTVLVKAAFFPLANKSYESMAKMKKLQPEMEKIRERFKDDRVKQQQELMALYKNEKINPMSGCLPILLQIPVFFALYKVLFITIDMRHAPFFGWIKDLSAPDPTSVFNLFGLLPYTLPEFLHVGVWPLVMGMTMWVQMQLNPQQPDPMQQKIFNWMPVMFTFMLASFPSGLVIYWAWNNVLSLLQQYTIMRKNGAEIHLWKNIGLDGAVARVRSGNGSGLGEWVGGMGAVTRRGVEKWSGRVSSATKQGIEKSKGQIGSWKKRAVDLRQGRDGGAGLQQGEAARGAKPPGGHMTHEQALETLGLEAGATASEIDAAYRKQKGQHGSLNGSERLNEARETLRGKEGS